jgi:hypothetical protein
MSYLDGLDYAGVLDWALLSVATGRRDGHALSPDSHKARKRRNTPHRLLNLHTPHFLGLFAAHTQIRPLVFEDEIQASQRTQRVPEALCDRGPLCLPESTWGALDAVVVCELPCGDGVVEYCVPGVEVEDPGKD